MQSTNINTSFGGVVLLVALLLLCPAATGGPWLSVGPDGSTGVQDAAPAAAPQVTTRSQGDIGLSVSVDLTGLVVEPTKTTDGEFVTVAWPEASISGEIGAPALPVIRCLLVAPPGATVTFTLVEGPAGVVDLAATGLPPRVMPKQPPIPKIPGARENAVFHFDESAYILDLVSPDERVVVEELGMVRGQRLLLLEVRPVAYNPARAELTLWPQISVEVAFAGVVYPESELSPLPGLHRVVINPEVLPQTAPRGSGNYLIIVASEYESDITAFAAAKEAQGFTVSSWTADPGTSSTAIKNYIESLWGGDDSPDYVLLVGDTDTIPHWVGQGSGSPDTDLPYACMDGAGDWYPDIALGRFSARSASQLQAIVDKTLYYEDGPLEDPEYRKRAAFMASFDNWEISEGTHEYVINTWLEPNGYECDRLYQHTYGATTQDVRDSFNDGRFYGIYSGHGGSTSWADGPPFSQSDVNNLTNENMYAFICSFACSTGDYADYDECFMETWVRAPNKAGVASWGSSVSSYWDEDDILERVLFDAIFDNEDEVKTEAGPIYNEARVRYLGHFGSSGTTRRYFEMYNLMGDPALPLPSACSDAGGISLDRTSYACESTAQIEVTDCGLNLDDGVVDTVDITMASDSEPTGETVTLYETDAASAQFEGSITLSGTDAGGVLLVAEGDTVTATYIDEDDGQGGYDIEVTDTAVVDCTPPNIWNIQTTDIEPRSAVVTFEADEPVRGIVYYGLSCDALDETATGSGYSTSPTVNLVGLDDDTTYFYSVEAQDEAGNSVTDDAGGLCYMFTTPEVPDYFTEIFESGDNDLDNLSLIFTPDGSNDFYRGCVEEIAELPTDPAGGTTLSLSDDDYGTCSLSGGETVSIYDNGYSTFFPGSNGYITFVHGESGYTESLELHFSGIPRISALYDDLDPSQAGTVSWKQLTDRAVVTWENVTEHSGSNSNTFQIEMYFDGTIVISYLAIAATDGLAGLSEGNGLDPDFYETDLSEMGACAALTIALPEGTPWRVDPGLPTVIPVQIEDGGETVVPGSETLYYRFDGGTFLTSPLTPLGGNLYEATLPAASCGDQPEFYFSATGDGGTTVYEPLDAPASVYSAIVATLTIILDDDFETDQGWTVEDDPSLTSGSWERGLPAGDGTRGDPVTDYDGSGQCYLTDNQAGDSDVDGGPTRLISPTLDLSGTVGPVLRYARWFTCDDDLPPAQDYLDVEVSDDDGASWTLIESVPSTEGWVERTIHIADYVGLTSQVRVRFSVTDNPNNSIDEAGIDAVEVFDLACVAAGNGDFDGDGDVDLADFAGFQACFGSSPVSPACRPGDMDGSNSIDLDDCVQFVAELTGPY